MYTEEDRRRLLESRHDLGALAEPGALTDNKVMQDAAVASRDELAAAREALRLAASSIDREHTETDAERLKLSTALLAATRRYGFIRSKVQDALLNVDPDASPEKAEIERRQRLFNRVFGAATSDLERLGQGALIERLGSVLEALSQDPDLAPLKHDVSLGAVHKAAQDAAQSLSRETSEDAEAMKVLRAAREAFDRSASAHSHLMESILVRQKREAELGRFVLAREAAYAARRANHTPISAEPDAEQPGAAPAATPATPPAAAG